MVSEKPILWSQIVDTDKQTLHRLWQENNGITLDVFHQISRDGGETWENAVKVFGVTDPFAEISLAKDWEGHLYLTQTRVENRSLIVEVSKWDGTQWVNQEKKEVNIKEENVQHSTVASITPQGWLNVMVSLIYPDSINGPENKIISFTRLLEVSGETSLTLPLLIPTSVPVTALTALPEVVSTATTSSPLANLSDPPSSSSKNLIGLLLVGGVITLIVIMIWPEKKVRPVNLYEFMAW